MKSALLVALLLLTNSDRAAAHLPPLTRSAQLSEIAQSRAVYLCNHAFSHAGWEDWFTDVSGYIGENLAKGFPDATSTDAALMASPTHRANILGAHYRHVGIGSACGVTVEAFSQ